MINSEIYHKWFIYFFLNDIMEKYKDWFVTVLDLATIRICNYVRTFIIKLRF